MKTGNFCMSTLVSKFVLYLVLFVFISCNNDDFFMIDYPDISSDIQVIGSSKEYKDFLIEYYTLLNRTLEADTSQMELYCDFGSKKIYCTRDTFDFSIVMLKLKELECHFRDYSSSTPSKQKMILDYAVYNDMELRKLLKIKPFKRTQSGYNEDAFIAMLCYPYTGGYFFRDDTRIEVGTSAYVKCAAALATKAKRVEHGGYGWPDGSGVVLYDANATDSSMRMLTYFNDHKPDYSFHVHPSGNLSPSGKDIQYWIYSNIEQHLILDDELGCKKYRVIGSEVFIEN